MLSSWIVAGGGRWRVAGAGRCCRPVYETWSVPVMYWWIEHT